MKINSFSRHFRESFRSIKRNAMMSIASISAVTVTLLIVGVFLTVMLNVNNMATGAEKDVQVQVFIDLTAKKADQDVLKKEIEKIDEVASIEYVTKDEALENLITDLGEEGKTFETYGEDGNPLRDEFIVKTKDPKDIVTVASKIEKLDNVFSVNYGEEIVDKLFAAVKIVRNVGFVLIVGLLFTAMFLISNTIKITIFARKTEIEIMRLVGAKNSFIRGPFLIEGLLIGLMGSIIPIVVIVLSYNSIYNSFPAKLFGTMFKMTEPNPLVFEVSIILALIGGFIGMWGSLISVRKFLKI